MKHNYTRIMNMIFAHEGGYVDHPKDPGGATNMGITHKTLAAHRGVKKVTKAEVRALTKKEAREIYRKSYWNAIRGDELPDGLDAVTMDAAVNSGVSRGSKWLQSAIGVRQDGRVGPKTLEKAHGVDLAKAVDAACDKRLAFLKGLPTWKTFGKGWDRRVRETREMGHQCLKPSKPVRPETAPPVKTTKKGLGAIIAAIIAAIVAMFKGRKG